MGKMRKKGREDDLIEKEKNNCDCSVDVSSFFDDYLFFGSVIF